MKKTSATALTAAVFAAALNFMPEPGSADAASPQQNRQADAAIVTTTTTTMPMSVPLYGPPWMFEPATTPQDNEDADTRTTTVFNEDSYLDETTTTTAVMTTPLYGPPWVFGTTTQNDEDTEEMYSTTTTATNTKPAPVLEPGDRVIAEINENLGPIYGPQPYFGDINGDGRVNTFDLVSARQLIVSPPDENDPMVTFPLVWAGDLNKDGVFSIADIVKLNKFLEGKTDAVETQNNENNEDIKTTGTNDVYDHPDGTTTTTSVMTTPLYGPPWVFGQ